MRTKSDDLEFRSLVLSQEFSRYVLEHPRFAERIPYGAEVVLLPTYDRELRDYNLRNGAVNNEHGLPIVYIEINRLRPRRSLIVKPKLKNATKFSVTGKPQRRKKVLLTNA
jgi:hypothetical protein